VADSPQGGGRKPTSPPSGVEVHDEETSKVPTPPTRSTRQSLGRNVARPSFLLDLQEGSPVGEYEIQQQIGEGAMGTVYSAIHPLIGKRVAVKVLKPELCANPGQVDRFVQEAQTVNRIGHPNIVDVFSLGELPDGRAYMVMEWLRGEDLKTRLARGPITVADACDILDGIARALDAAHAKDIVHRDLKPDNVFLHQVDNGPLMVKLLDFGIAKLVRVTPGMEKTQTGNMLGTPRYISPEQARGISVDARSDIYSLGVMAYEMLAGRPPFQGETAMDLVVKHLSEEPPPLSQFAKVPKSIEQCVMRMLAKEPALRPSLETVRQVLVDPTRRFTPAPPRGTMRVKMPMAPVSRRPIFAIAGVCSIALGIATWWIVSTAQRDARAPAPAPTPAPAPAVAPAPPTPAPAPAPAPPPPARATLQIDVTGSKDAVILVDGKEWGRGESIKVELDPGAHDIVVKPPGRKPVEQEVDLRADQLKLVSIDVPPPPPARPVRVPPRPQPKKDPKKPSSDDDLLRPARGR
jgi:serine/threonine-protein kinase